MSTDRFVDATRAQAMALLQRGVQGPVDMLNLLRFREVADYSASPSLAPEHPISGERAYRRYMAHTAPFLAEAGGEVLYAGTGGGMLIGPGPERWDLILVVRHRDVATFLSFAQNPGYLAGAGHRTAALLDSRLLPMSAATLSG